MIRKRVDPSHTKQHQLHFSNEMASINHALAMADAIRHKLDTGIHDPANRATSPTEILEGLKQKEKVRAYFMSGWSSNIDAAI